MWRSSYRVDTNGQAAGSEWAPVLLCRWRLSLTSAAGLIIRCIVGQAPGLCATAAAVVPTAVGAAARAVDRQPPALVQHGRLGLQLPPQRVDLCLKFGDTRNAISCLLYMALLALSRAAQLQ